MKLFPRTLEVALTQEQYSYVADIAAVMKVPHSAVVRAMVDSELTESVVRARALREEKAL